MKRIGIVSDSHGMRGMLEQSLIKLEAGGPLDALIHCGDGGSDAKYLAGNILQTVIVRGNCDGWGCDYEDDMLVNIGGVSIFVTHGHRYGVKSGLDTLASAAAATISRMIHNRRLRTGFMARPPCGRHARRGAWPTAMPRGVRVESPASAQSNPTPAWPRKRRRPQ